MSSGAVPSPNLLPPLQDYLEACQRRFATCLAPLDEWVTVDGVNADVTFHFVKFDPTTKDPKFDLLAKALAKHVVRFCLSARARQNVQSQSGFDADEAELFMIARDYFRKLKDSGEVGELLLFFLLEAAVGAPQVVCKMELKTNPNDEVKGADGIHIKWDEDDEHLDVFLGEAKLFQDIGAAMTKALDSVKDIYERNRLDEELHLVTAHFKHLDEEFQRKVTAWVNRETSEEECHIIHSCLIGWDWSQYKRLQTERDALFDEFEAEYRKYCTNIGDLLSRRFQDYSHRHLSFHFLFVLFASGYLFEEFDITEEGEFFTETLAPVSQVLVNLDPVEKKTKLAKVSVVTPRGIEEVGEAQLPFKFRQVYESLAGTAMLVRQKDESVIIFANRPHDAMEIAEKVAESVEEDSTDRDVLDLIDFVKTHVHPRYSLADALIKGVAFHYGRMPHVIRSQVEELLRTRRLSYVVSTSTLLQGVNLPARHIVVLNPKQGNKTPMRAPDFWNLVGRAGRLRENFRGIVWCVDPSSWETKPLEGERLSEIKSAFQTSLEDSKIREAAIAVLDGTAPVSMVTDRNRVEQFIGKTFSEFTLQDQKLSTSNRVPANVRPDMVPLEDRLETLRAQLKVPEEVCFLNAVIAPTLLNDLWDRFSAGVTTEMVPVDPFQPNAIGHFRTIFQIIQEVFIGSDNNSWKYFSTLGYFWVMGQSLRELIDNRLSFYKVNKSNKKAINKHIRELLDDIELTLRFTYVRYLKAYIDVLRAFYIGHGKEDQSEALAPWDLYVEFGARDRVLLQLMSIGVSRSTAILIRKAISSQPEISRDECWSKLQKLHLNVLAIPGVCKEEIRVLTGNSN